MIRFYLICDNKDLEVKTLLIILLLRKYLKKEDFDISILYPETNRRRTKSIEIFNSLGYNTIPFRNELNDYKNRGILPGDRVSNKLYFIKYTSSNESRSIFLDSDMMLINKFNINDLITNVPFSAKQVDRANVTKWNEIYSFFGMKMPDIRELCTVDNILLPPYFNAGFISIKPSIAKDLFHSWAGFYKQLSDPKVLRNGFYNPFNRDQVSLALSVQELGLDVKMLPEEFNYPVRSKPLSNNVIFAHYHDPQTIYRNLTLRALFFEVLSEHTDLLKLVKREINWSMTFYSPLTRFIISHPLAKKLIGLSKQAK